MTLEEFCQKYSYAESSVLHGFPRVKESILKTYGVEIIKIGRGKKAIDIDEALSNCDDKTDREVSVPKVVG